MILHKNKKLLLTMIAGLAVSNFSFADESNVTLYGVLDVGIASLTNAENAVKGSLVKSTTNPAPTPGADWNGLANGGLAASRWGITGKEQLSSDLVANFTLESSLFPTNGEAGATNVKGSANYNATVTGPSLFNRVATVGLAGNSWGTVNLGRDRTIAYEQAGLFDPTSTGQGLSNFGGIGSFSVYNISRIGNQIKYYSPELLGIQLGLAYSTLGLAGSSSAGDSREFYLGYKNDGWKLFTAYQQTTTFVDASNGVIDQYYGAATDSTNPNPGSTGFRVWQFGGEGHIGDWKFNIGYDSRNDASAAVTKTVNGQADINVLYAGVGYQINPNQRVTLSAYQEQDKRYASGNDATMVTGQYVYQLSKRTSLYGIVSHVDNQSNTYITVTDNANVYVQSSTNTGSTPGKGDAQTGVMLGILHQF